MLQQLDNSLLALIEHVELNRSGWWDVALGNVLLAAVWVHGEPIWREQVRELVNSAFSFQIPPDRITIGIDRLLAEGKMVIHGNDRLALADGVAERMKARLEAARDNESAVRTAFVEQIGECCAPHTPEQAWNLFTKEYLLPLINVLGARTLQFMGGEDAGDEDVGLLTDEFVRLFEASHRQEIRSAVGGFLDPGDANVRRYVTEHLDASFLVKASGLTNATIAAISRFGQSLPTFRLFLDTNFLFSLLDLHENPSNEATQMLGKTIRQISNHLSIQMSVINPTVDEMKRTLSASAYDLAGVQMSPTVADAALHIGLSGIAIRFARANAESTRTINAREYFEPYINNLTIILKTYGIDVCGEPIEEYKQRQDVIDDLLEMAEVTDLPEARQQRKYNAALHDSILWHFVHDRRPAVFESPLDAVAWVVTNDYRLIRFDKRRHKAANLSAGICIHPAELIQILRMWEPRSTDMEQALMSGLRLPFMFYEFESGMETASMRILKVLSRLEHVRNLDSKAIRDIVLNDALRSTIVEANSEEEEIELIRDTLLAELKSIADQRDAAAQSGKIVEETLISEREATQRRAIAGQDERAHAEKRISELEVDLQNAQQANRAISDRLQDLETAQNKTTVQKRIRSARIHTVLIRGVGAGFFIAAATAGLGYGWGMVEKSPLWLILLTMLTVWLGVWFLVSTTRVRDTDIKSWAPMRTLLNLRSRTKWFLGSILVAIIGNAIWQMLIWPFFYS